MLGLATAWNVLIAVGLGLLVAWIVLVVTLFVLQREEPNLREALRIVPDTLRLLRRIAADRTVPRGVRVRLYALFVYLASPIDLIPDFIPLIGFADDAVIVAAALRSVMRRAGADTIRRHWPGTDEGLATLSRIARLPAPS